MAASQDLDVLVVGAGIAGLAAAIALDRAGIRVQVIEKATALTQAGTALSLWPNALAALELIGLSKAIAAIGIVEPNGTICEWSGREIVRLNQSRLQQRLGTPTLVVHRGDLQQVLLDAASHLPMRLRTSVTRVSTEGDEGAVELSDGQKLRASVVLGCDGLRSVARQVIANPPPRFTGRTSWRAVLDDPSHSVTEAILSVGRGMQFITSPMKGGRIYWAADAAMPEGANEALADRKGFLLKSFAGWHHPITDLIERTPEGRLVIADLYDAVPRVLTAGRVALLGDAAHPMTPDLGQGACQGIEDGVVIAACLSRNPSPTTALANYQAARLRRVRSMVRGSRRVGRVATAESQVVTAIRNTSVAHMPDWLNARIVARYASEHSFLDTLPAGPRDWRPTT